MIKVLIFSLMLAAQFTFAAEDTRLKQAEKLIEWLDGHFKEFSDCETKKAGPAYRFCDGTSIDKKELEGLFRMKTIELIKLIQSQGIKLEVLCSDSDGNPALHPLCKQTLKRKAFESITPLHGQFLPEENTILLKSRASHGSLVHEYLHYLQNKNANPVYGKLYKKERVEAQKNLTKIMDENISKVQAMQKSGNTAELKGSLAAFMKSSELLRSFAFWQDLIDERSIFLLYINFGKELGISSEDIKFAKRNMQTICKNEKMRSTLPTRQCNYDL